MAKWGRKGTKTRLYCAKHGRERGMVDFDHKQCAVDGCTTQPTYGPEGGPAKYCKTHAEEGMVDVVSKRCAVYGCNTQPSYGREGGPATHCAPHGREKGMVNVVSKQCAVEGCETIPSYGLEGGPATHCGPHALPDMRDVVHRKCASCGLFIVNEAPHLCSYCTPNTSKHQKTREMKIKALLEATTDLNDPIHDKPVGGDCGKYRPDFRYNALTHSVVVEVDEDQHRSYDPECERIRIINIVQAVGMRCVFVRYNPDAFKIDGKTVRVYEKKRHELLLRTIRECMKPSFDSEISRVVYLYYDGAEIRHQEDLFGSSTGLESRRSTSS